MAEGNTCAGVYFLSKLKKIRALFLPKVITFEESGTKRIVLLGSTSDKTGAVKAAFVEKNIAHNFMAIEEKNSHTSIFVAGASFKKGDHALLDPFLAKSDVDYVLLKIPVGFLIPFGIPLCVGLQVEQTVYDGMRAIDDDAAAWIKYVDSMSTDLQVVLSDGKATLQAILPALKANQHWTVHAHLKISSLSEEMEELFADELEQLETAVSDARNRNLAAAAEAAKGTAADNAVDVDGDENSTIKTAQPIRSITIPRKSTSTPGVAGAALASLANSCRAASVASLANPTGEELRRSRLSILFSAKCPVQGILLPPIFSDEGEAIISGTTAATRQHSFLSTLLTKEEEMADELHFLFRAVEPPSKLDPLTVSYLNECILRAHPLACLSDATEKKGATLATFIPDSGKAGSREAIDDERAAEELLGETTELLTKMSTSISVNTALNRPANALSLLANIVLYIRTFVIIDDTIQPPPQLYQNAVDLGTLITSSAARDMLRRDPEVASYLSYWVYATMESFFVQMAKQTRIAAALRHAAAGNFHAIPTDYFDSGSEAFAMGIKAFRMATSGGATLPEPSVYKNSDAKKAKEKRTKNSRIMPIICAFFLATTTKTKAPVGARKRVLLRGRTTRTPSTLVFLPPRRPPSKAASSTRAHQRICPSLSSKTGLIAHARRISETDISASMAIDACSAMTASTR